MIVNDEIEKQELDNLLAHCMMDIKVCCGALFPDIFTSPFSILHDQIFDIINAGHTKIAIAAPPV